jgi:hypothetical protein
MVRLRVILAGGGALLSQEVELPEAAVQATDAPVRLSTTETSELTVVPVAQYNRCSVDPSTTYATLIGPVEVPVYLPPLLVTDQLSDFISNFVVPAPWPQ